MDRSTQLGQSCCVRPPSIELFGGLFAWQRIRSSLKVANSEHFHRAAFTVPIKRGVMAVMMDLWRFFYAEAFDLAKSLTFLRLPDGCQVTSLIMDASNHWIW